MLAFSTCWNNSRHTCGEAMIEEIVGMGFEWVELSHGMTVAKLPGIRRAYARGIFRCVGVHNYFPSPVEVMIDAPDAYEYTSYRAWDRERAMEMTMKTLEVADEFEAKYVVLHMGSVPMDSRKWTKVLTREMGAGAGESEEWRRRKIAFVKKREKLAPLYFSRAVDALGKIAEKAREYGLVLAVESRSRFEDMPNEDEMVRLQEVFAGDEAVRYWHDFGHVQLKHFLGLLDHEEWLGKMRPYVFGAHVHDVEWPARDHRVPLTATLDFERLLGYFPEGCPLTWEISSGRRKSQIEEKLVEWRRRFPERC